MKKGVYYRLCKDYIHGGMCAVETKGYVETFTTSDGITIELGFHKGRGMSEICATELETGVRANTTDAESCTTYDRIIEYYSTHPEVMDSIYEMKDQYAGILTDLIMQGKVITIEEAKANNWNFH